MYQPQTGMTILDVNCILIRGKEMFVQWTVKKSKCKPVSGKILVTTCGKSFFLSLLPLKPQYYIFSMLK
jgi:hypothetical protein